MTNKTKLPSKLETELELQILEGERKEITERLDNGFGFVTYYVIPTSFVGTISGLIGGAIGYLLTKNPTYIAQGAAIGGIIGTIIGITSSQHLTLNELVQNGYAQDKLKQKKQ